MGLMCLVLSGTAVAASGLPPIVESQPESPEAASPAPSSQAVQTQPPRQRDQQRPRTVDERVARLERLMDSQALVDMLMRLQNLQQEVSELRGQIEVQAHAVEGVKQRQRELYLDIDRRMRQLEVAVANASQAGEPSSSALAGGSPEPSVSAPAAPAAAAGPDSAGTGAASQPTVDPLAEQKAYQKAFDVLKAGRYEESISAFRAFLARYPDGEYSANAQYWLGEANYVMNRYPAAIEEFRKVVELHPSSSKTADALLKLGYSHYELEKYDEARSTLNQLVEQYPDSTAAQLAQNRLHRMRLEGR